MNKLAVKDAEIKELVNSLRDLVEAQNLLAPDHERRWDRAIKEANRLLAKYEVKP